MKKYSFKSLQLTINEYGFEYSTKDFIITLIIGILLLSCVCYVQKIAWWGIAMIAVSLIVYIPIMIVSHYKFKAEKRKFKEYCMYYEYMCIYFKSFHKIKLALLETQKLFDVKSTMYRCIDNALKIIEVNGDYKSALAEIDKVYHNTYLDKLHFLLLQAEYHGDDGAYYALDRLGYKEWCKDIKKQERVYRKGFKILCGMTIFCFGMSCFMVFILSTGLFQAYIATMNYQLLSFLEYELLLIMFVYLHDLLFSLKLIRGDE